MRKASLVFFLLVVACIPAVALASTEPNRQASKDQLAVPDPTIPPETLNQDAAIDLTSPDDQILMCPIDPASDPSSELGGALPAGLDAAAAGCGNNFCTNAQRAKCSHTCKFPRAIGLECCFDTCTSFCNCGSIPTGC